MVLGDAYLQATGKKNARIRLEHSIKQKEYLMWKADQFPKLFSGKPKTMKRYNAKFGKSYEYIRWQSNSSPVIGKLRQKFYREDSGRKIPSDIKKILITPVALAVWFMDDGYYYALDKMAYIYLPNMSEKDFDLLLEALKVNFDLFPKLKRKKHGWCLSFGVGETAKLIEIVSPHICESMLYKVTT